MFIVPLADGRIARVALFVNEIHGGPEAIVVGFPDLPVVVDRHSPGDTHALERGIASDVWGVGVGR